MAPAALASRHELNWPPQQNRAGYMGKHPFLNNNPNPNSSLPSLPRKQQQQPQHHQIHPISHQNGDDVVRPAASDDASSFNRRPYDGGDVMMDLSHYVSFDISSFSRSELRSLRSRLMTELEWVRSLANRIDSGELQPTRNSTKSPPPVREKKLSGNKRWMPPAATGPVKEVKRPAATSSASPAPPVVPNVMVVGSAQLMKSCALLLNKMMKPKDMWIFNAPVDAAAWSLNDYHQVIKHPMDLGTVKSKHAKSQYRSPEDFAADVRLTFNNALQYNPKGHEVNSLAQVKLERFEEMFLPIAEKFEIEKQEQLRHLKPPEEEKQNHMQLERQIEHQHSHPQVKQNHRPHPAPGKREQMMHIQEEKYRNQEKQHQQLIEEPSVEEVQASSWSKNPSPESPKIPPAPPMKAEKVMESTSDPPPQQQESAPPRAKGPAGRAPSRRLPKPKAKDPNKREMASEEKLKLGGNLQELPDEKMEQVVEIIRKRNGRLNQNGDEIELDIEAMDTETLWELDRFVTNHKKAESKIKRQGLINSAAQNYMNQAASNERAAAAPTAADDAPGGGPSRKPKRGDAGDEDVDIGDEMPMRHFPPLEIEIEKDEEGGQGGVGGGGNAGGSSSSSSSSSSDSDSSSSSDSSGSSSGSDSDVDDAQSRDNESKNLPAT